MRILDGLPGWLIFVTAAAALTALALLSHKMESEASDVKLQSLQNPRAHVSEQICLGYLRVDSLMTQGVRATDRSGYLYYFRVEPSGFEKGARYSFRGRIMADGRVDVEDYQHHPRRRLKYAFSLLSVLLVLYIIIRYIRFDPAGPALYVGRTDTGLFSSGRKRT